MANTHSNLTSLFTDIASAIREKTGNTDNIVADAFPRAIRAIELGMTLPTLTKPGAANTMLSGYQLINGSGNVVTGTIPTKTSSNLTASGSTITVPSGYYSAQVSKKIASVAQATPSITVDASGLITATATQGAGYVVAGTKSATKQLTTQGAQTITPGITDTTIASQTYLTGVQTIKGDANLIAENIKSGVSIFGVSGTLDTSGTSESIDNELFKGIVERSIVEAYNESTTRIGEYAFYKCSKLEEVNFPNVSCISASAFFGCSKLTTAYFPECLQVDFDAFSKCALTSIYFPKCKYIENRAFNGGDFKSINFPECIDIGQSAFKGCQFMSFACLPKCNEIGYSAFAECYNLQSLYLGNSEVCSLAHSSAFYMTPYAGYSTSFSGTPYIYVPASLISNYQTATNWSYFFSYFSAIEIEPAPSQQPTAVLYEDGSMVFYGNDVTLDTTKNIIDTYTGWDTEKYSYSSGAPWYKEHALDIQTVSFVGNVNAISTAYWFMGCENLTNIDVTNLDTSKVTDMRYMFRWCYSLTSLDLSNFDTSEVTNMEYIFGNCESLVSLNISNFNTSKVVGVGGMFFMCESLTSLDLSNFNTSNVTNMAYMFENCKKLTSLDVSSFDTSNVTSMRSMFNECYSLTSLDLSNFNTSNVTNMVYMFSLCSNLTTIYASELWTTEYVSDSELMFQGCAKLSGDIKFNSNYIDKTYATTTGGYLTYKKI